MHNRGLPFAQFPPATHGFKYTVLHVSMCENTMKLILLYSKTGDITCRFNPSFLH